MLGQGDPAPEPDAAQHEAGVDREEDRRVELVADRLDEGAQVLLGATERAGRAVQDVEDLRAALVAGVERELQGGERHGQRILDALPPVGGAEEAVAAVEQGRPPGQPGLPSRAEGATAVVEHERRVLDEVGEAEP